MLHAVMSIEGIRRQPTRGRLARQPEVISTVVFVRLSRNLCLCYNLTRLSLFASR